MGASPQPPSSLRSIIFPRLVGEKHKYAALQVFLHDYQYSRHSVNFYLRQPGTDSSSLILWNKLLIDTARDDPSRTQGFSFCCMSHLHLRNTRKNNRRNHPIKDRRRSFSSPSFAVSVYDGGQRVNLKNSCHLIEIYDKYTRSIIDSVKLHYRTFI